MNLIFNVNGALLLAMALFLINLTCPACIVLPDDPVLGLSLRSLFWAVGGLAFAVSFICLFDSRLTWKMVMLAWLATNLLVYQLGVYWEGLRR